jgi:hypothetical protein
MTGVSAAIFSVNFLGLFKVQTWEFTSTDINSFWTRAGPGNPRTDALQFCELVTGRSVFSWKCDEEVRDETLTGPGMFEVTISCGC